MIEFILSWQQNNWPHLFIPLLYPLSFVLVGYLFQCNNVKLTSESCQTYCFFYFPVWSSQESQYNCAVLSSQFIYIIVVIF